MLREGHLGILDPACSSETQGGSWPSSQVDSGGSWRNCISMTVYQHVHNYMGQALQQSISSQGRVKVSKKNKSVNSDCLDIARTRCKKGPPRQFSAGKRYYSCLRKFSQEFSTLCGREIEGGSSKCPTSIRGYCSGKIETLQTLRHNIKYIQILVSPFLNHTRTFLQDTLHLRNIQHD
jgi:hypothetical protein